MNPEMPRVQPQPEALPQIPGASEYQPGGIERVVESRPEVAPRPSLQLPPAQPVTLPAHAPPAPVIRPADDTTAISGVPSVAGDDDLIEKEWVDKLKKIITLTAGNPHERARVIAQLQADYLKKRYNKTLGKADG
ncbi:MAG: hypothetical protein Q4A34_02220 [Candidatus Saccharibacteria bacterium]|nr:hypothetical protein [Candidatus Saccharibacteria bacterium]